MNINFVGAGIKSTWNGDIKVNFWTIDEIKFDTYIDDVSNEFVVAAALKSLDNKYNGKEEEFLKKFNISYEIVEKKYYCDIFQKNVTDKKIIVNNKRFTINSKETANLLNLTVSKESDIDENNKIR